MSARPPRPVSIPIPGLSRDVGLGRAIAAVTRVLGVAPCAGCRRRADDLDARVVFRSLRRHEAPTKE